MHSCSLAAHSGIVLWCVQQHGMVVGLCCVVWISLCMQEVLEAEDIAAAVLYALGAPARVDVSYV